jgi:addiction module HigA family antidote
MVARHGTASSASDSSRGPPLTYSIRINDRWRICFAWRGGDAHDVEIVDYHWGAGETTMKPSKRLDPIHPGEILLEDFMKPLGISINRLARDLDVPPNRIAAIVNGTRSITADTALRLGTYFRVSPETWLGLQIDYDLRLIRQRDGDRIVRSIRARPAA